MRHPIGEVGAAMWHAAFAVGYLFVLWFHLEAARRHWGQR